MSSNSTDVGGSIVKITQLLLRAYALEEELRVLEKKLRDDPPNDPLEIAKAIEEIAAVAEKISALYQEIKKLNEGGVVSRIDITAAYQRNATGLVDRVVPPEPDPDQPPVDWPTPGLRLAYTTIYRGPVLGYGDLMSRGAKDKDWVFTADSGNGTWALLPAKLLSFEGFTPWKSVFNIGHVVTE